MEKPKKAVILLSRQNLRPSLSDAWVRSLIEAVKYVKASNYKLLSSVGTANWEIITACASVNRARLKLIVPLLIDEDMNHKIADLENDFGLDPGLKEFDWIQSDEEKKITEKSFKFRDKLITRTADVLIPISIRPNGHLEQLIQKESGSGKKVINDFAVSYVSKRKKLNYTINPKDLSNNIKQLGSNYIIHWTRATSSPWPFEKRIDYYNDIFSSNEYPRSALATLMRIIESKMILGTSKNMPAKIRTVSWSGLAPVDTIGLMRWRPRFRQMSFEPYGIGIKKESAFGLGVRPVKYYNPKLERVSQSEPIWLNQSMGRVSDWSKENEFRYKGDFDLRAVLPEHLIAITYKQSEAIELENMLEIKTAWFCD